MSGGCSQTAVDTVNPSDEGSISFSATGSWGIAQPSFSEAAASRVTAEGNFEAGDRMGIFAYCLPDGTGIGTATPDFMYNQPVTLNNGGWTYSPTKYWPATGSLAFFAYYPYNSPYLSISSNSDTGHPVLKYENAEADTDLLAAQTGAITQANSTNGKISLSFKHLLAKVNISFTYQGNPDAPGLNDYRPMIHMIRFRIPTGGTYSYEEQAEGLPSWTDVTATTALLTRYTAPEGVFITQQKQKIEEFTSYLLPATIDSFEVSINHIIVSYTPPAPIKITAGKEITLNFNIASVESDNSLFISSYTMWEDGGEITGDLR